MGSATMETVKAEEYQQHFTGAGTKNDILQREDNWKTFTSQRMASIHSCHTRATHSWHRLQQASTRTHDVQQNRHCWKDWKLIFRKKEVETYWNQKQKTVKLMGKGKRARGKENMGEPICAKERGKDCGDKNTKKMDYVGHRRKIC